MQVSREYHYETIGTILLHIAPRTLQKRAVRLAVCVLGAATILASAASSLHAQILVQWTFETSQPAAKSPTTYTPEFNPGSLAASASVVGVNVVTSPTGNGSAHSFSANGWTSGGYFQFNVDASNAANLGPNFGISFDQTGSNTGPRDFEIMYSTDGTNYTLLPGSQYAVTNVTFSSTTSNAAASHFFDLSSIAGINTSATDSFRVFDYDTTAVTGGTVAAAGTDRVDNFTVSVPEPRTVLGGLLLVGTAFWLCARRVMANGVA